MASKIFVSAAFTEGAGERHKVFMMARCNKRLGEITRNMRDELRLCICQEVPRLFSSGEHRTVTEIVAREIMILNPDADRDSICRFDANGLLRDWNMSYCSITELPESFRDLLCTGDLNLNENKLRCLPPNFEQIRVGGSLRLSGNQLQSLPRSFATLSVGGNLNLSGNKLRRLPPNFEQIRVGGSLRLSGNPELTGIPTEFPNVKGTVYRP